MAASLYSPIFQHILRRMDPEQAHRLTVSALHRAHSVPGGPAALRAAFRTPAPGRDPRPTRTVLGSEHHTPFGLAAGFDKAGEVPLALLDLGFGHVEIGTVTARPQPGNEKPRSFRLPADRALVNRMGFNNPGAAAVAVNLARARRAEHGRRAIIGVNIGKSKVTPLDEAAVDYRRSAAQLAPFASYLAINVSSPNTPGLRDLQSTASLRPILEAVQEEAVRAGEDAGREIPVLVKIAPDLHDQDILEVADLSQEVGIDGVIATNTTISRPASLSTDRTRIEEIGAGGLSGPILAARSLEILRLLRAHLPASATVISCGGVSDAGDVRERLDAGADLVQGYTALIYEGPGWPGRIARSL